MASPASAPRLQIFPVKLAQDAIYVDVSNSRFASANMGRGGMGTSIENNNVFTVSTWGVSFHSRFFSSTVPADSRLSALMCCCPCHCPGCPDMGLGVRRLQRPLLRG